MTRRLVRLWPAVFWVALAFPAQTPAPDSSFRFAVAGDSIINRRISVYDEPGYLEMFARIRNADAAFTNFETLVNDFEYPGAPVSGGTYMASPAWVIDELKWAGFRLFGIANNHSFDYGTDGLLSNIRAFRKAGVVYAGAGENLARARAPAYLDTKKGRVALIACASTFSILSPAGPQRPDMPGRPGLNPLRFKTTYTVDSATFAALSNLTGSGEGATSAPVPRTELRFLGASFRSGDQPGVTTEPNVQDVKEITAEIRDARRQADWVMVSIHAHEGAPRNREVPAEFLAAFAHASIDAGADLFVAHGPHVLRGIEIYKGKPIFYSMANFIFQNETLQFEPQEVYDEFHLPLTATPADYYDARSANDTRGFPADKEYWQSVVAEAVFNEKRELQQIVLSPITLGFGESRTHRGRPMPASRAMAATIIDRVAKLSKLMGTTVTFEDGKGVIEARHSP